MNLLKQNSDYALRIMTTLGELTFPDGSLSAKKLATMENISEHFTAKILQKLAKAGLVVSIMGKNGGYKLTKRPSQITMLDVTNAMQGEISLNNCSPAIDSCPRQPHCPIAKFVCQLDQQVKTQLTNITIENIIDNHKAMKGVSNEQ